MISSKKELDKRQLKIKVNKCRILFCINGKFLHSVKKISRALRFKGIPFDTVNYNGILGAKVPLLSKVGKVPVIDHNGQRIQDSTRIARYLDEAFPDTPRLYPEDPNQKALAELWEDWADESLYFYEVYLRVNDPEALEEAIRISSIGRPAYEKPMVKGFILAELKTQLFFPRLRTYES